MGMNGNIYSGVLGPLGKIFDVPARMLVNSPSTNVFYLFYAFECQFQVTPVAEHVEGAG